MDGEPLRWQRAADRLAPLDERDGVAFQQAGEAWSSRAGLLGDALAPWAVDARQEASARC